MKACLSVSQWLQGLFLFPSLILECITSLYLGIKLRLLPSKKVPFICYNENALKLMKNAFYFMLKVIFVLEIFTFLS